MSQNANPTTFPLTLLTPSWAEGAQNNDDLNLLVDAINQIASTAGASLRTLPNGGTRTLLNTDNYILTGTMGTNQVIVPPVTPANGQLVTIIDAVGNCGANPVTWQGTIAGDANPTLIDVAFASVQLFYTGTVWLRLR